jgi:hypothetical protein
MIPSLPPPPSSRKKLTTGESESRFLLFGLVVPSKEKVGGRSFVMSCKINRIAKSVAFFDDEDPIRNAAICSGFSILSCVCVKGAIYFLMGRYNNETVPSCTCSLILVGYVIPFFPSQTRQVEFGRAEPSETLDVSLGRLKLSAYLHRARAIKDGIHFGNAIEIQSKV